MDEVFLPGVVDLYGDPIPKSRGKRGRPAHVPTADFRRFVQLALACGEDEDAIAAALRITVRTLGRHYFHELAGKRAARLRLDMKNMAAIVAQVEAGKPAAMALLEKKLEKLRKRELAERHQVPEPVANAAKVGGVKAQRRAAAAEVGGKYATPAPPRSLQH